jgi:hypothetical protein
MAKVKMPLFSTEARGKVAGLVFNSWRGLNYVKSSISPAQPRTSRQLQIRAWAVQLVRAWAAVSAVNQQTWRDYATAHQSPDWSGSPVRTTGLNWYLKCNMRLLDQGKATIATAPIVAAPGSVAALVLTPGAGTISCAFTAFGGTDTSVDWWLVLGKGLGILPKLTMAKHRAFSPGETSPYVISALAPGNVTVFARSVSETTGLASAWVSASAVVT